MTYGRPSNAVGSTVDEAVILEAGRRLAALKALLAVDPEAPPVDAETQPQPKPAESDDDP